MEIPFEPVLWGIKINIHLVLEYLAFFVAFRYYIWLRRKQADTISSENRMSIIIGAAAGAYLGSRIIGILENPMVLQTQVDWYLLSQSKTIMGGLFGGLLGVEGAKKWIGESHSSGDLFTFPIILGIFVGRIGCFLSGVNEFTYGKTTAFFLGMNLGDGLTRHPVALYELIFLALLFLGLKSIDRAKKLESGMIFKYFMIAYFGFRFFIEFLKPNTFLILGLSTIQYLCLICMLYYHRVFLSLLHAK